MPITIGCLKSIIEIRSLLLVRMRVWLGSPTAFVFGEVAYSCFLHRS